MLPKYVEPTLDPHPVPPEGVGMPDCVCCRVPCECWYGEQKQKSIRAAIAWLAQKMAEPIEALPPIFYMPSSAIRKYQAAVRKELRKRKARR